MRCSRCGAEHDRKGQRYCLSCHAAYAREWRKTHPLTEKQRQRGRVRAVANAYQRLGKIAPDSCFFCGEEKTEKHHPDYEQPLAIVWLCRPCHVKFHHLQGVISRMSGPDVFQKEHRSDTAEAA
jgi:hypothetical protein